ncbi:LSU ribosomal protein L25p [uncultured Gammaproteobacteria bacterium]|jgi:large subunit ribosomal protein L25|nr:LSU ribosomal protein L25p [uncultured Gammaproteobacteria bacterium]CAC9555703.1 LSU ribosomal protein L25p [uncultured Gammaproteobacteria bacterium]CAC9562486.1 LSU ribosomal protein L25p [uncultured Gammaproteobacteria bacterium]CAC9571562.1 LSU ribosomal protein L25p [uncultured Gammaproteobacteria bacterium]CAC9604167.1 LSU ribosomal protein L25p [uncultured Gammaproteobacteria bacterium]
MNTVINATMREDQGKGASRRLRHNEQIPAIIYGAGKEPNTITLNLHEITHLLENEESYTSILDLTIDKKAQPVIIKDLQRHPAKNLVTHVDFLRINMNKEIVTNIPLHFMGEEDNEAMRLGAILNQFVTAIEVSCLPKNLPNAIEIDISKLSMGDHISLTGINMPEGVIITALTHGDIEAHDQSVVSVQEPKLMSEEVQVDVVEDEEGATEDGDDKAEDKDTSGS